jgi:hypothetical protein
VWVVDFGRVKTLVETGFKIDLCPIEHGPNYRRWRETGPRSILLDAVVAGISIFEVIFDAIMKYEEVVDFHPILVEAVIVKNLELQAFLLAAGTNINPTPFHGGNALATPFLSAVSVGDLDAVKLLYHNGADINVVGAFLHSIQFPVSIALQLSLCVMGKHQPRNKGNALVFEFVPPPSSHQCNDIKYIKPQ